MKNASQRDLRVNSDTLTQHVGLKGHSSADVFYDECDRAHFLESLGHACEEFNVDLLVYALMDNHVHLILRGEIENFKSVFESIGATFARPLNEKGGRSGAFWNARYFNGLIQTQQQFLRTAAYIFNNPVAAGMVSNPADYEWSNFRDLCDGEGGAARKAIDELVNVENLIDYTLAEVNRKWTRRELSELEFITTLKVRDDELFSIAFRQVGAKARKIEQLSEDVRRSIVREMWDFGGNANQISRITHISRYKVVQMIESF